MIHASSLSKRFGKFLAVDDVSFDVPAGRVVGFLGPNGAGKSTTLKMVSGFLPPSSGSVEVAGFDVIRASREARSRIGYLPESTPLYPEMRVIEYLRYRAKLFSVPRRERGAAIDMVIRRCWLSQVRRKPIAHLSKGYKQRVGLAAAMLHNPPVLLLDEPTSGLDPAQIREMRTLIRELASNHTVLLSTHILSEVEMTCDDVIIISGGQIRADGTLDEVRRQASSRSAFIIEASGRGASDAIAGVRGVIDVHEEAIDEHWSQYTIMVHSTADLREELARKMHARGDIVRELRREAPSLEQVFHDVTVGQREGGDASVEAYQGAAGATLTREVGV